MNDDATRGSTAPIRIIVTASIPQSRISSLKLLVAELLKVVPIPAEVSHLELRVVPRGTLGSEANRILNKQAYSPEAPPHGAVCLPLSRDGQLHCTILVGDDSLDGLSDTHRPDGLISSLLEEFLHAYVYGSRWSHFGDFLSSSDDPDAENHLLASRLHDEYVVSRCKNELAAQIPLFDAQGQPGYRAPRIFLYGGDLEALDAQAQQHIQLLRGQFQAGAVSYAEMEQYVGMGIVYRGLLDPLARSYGFSDGMPLADKEYYSLSLPQSQFFKSTVEPRWLEIYHELRNAYSDGMRYSHAAIQTIAYHIRILQQEIEGKIRFDDE